MICRFRFNVFSLRDPAHVKIEVAKLKQIAFD